MPHHELDRAIEPLALLTELEKSNDARVTQRSDDLHLVEEHRNEILAMREVVLDDFERDELVVVLGDRGTEAHTEINDGHPALADFGQHAIAP